MKLTGRRLQIATNGGGLPPEVVQTYRENWDRWGYELPEWTGDATLPEPSPPIVRGVKGVGTLVRERLARWGIRGSSCSCRSLARKMDENGPDWCRENLSDIVTEITLNAKRHRWMRFAPFKQVGAESIVLTAIKQHEAALGRAQRSKSIVWAAGMTTAPRKTSTIRRAWEGAVSNGWSPIVFAEPGSDLEGVDAQVVQHQEKKGIWFNWVFAASYLLEHFPQATHILTMQDDCVLVPNARAMVERWDWPADAGLLSLYLPQSLSRQRISRRRVGGIRRSPSPTFHGSLAVVYQRHMLEAILSHRIAQQWGTRRSRIPSAVVDDDICVGHVVSALKKGLYYAYPSCSQHVAEFSTRRNGRAATGNSCAEWIAEDALRDCFPSESD